MLFVLFYTQQRGFLAATLCFFRIPPANFQDEGGIHEQKSKETEAKQAGQERGRENVSCAQPELQVVYFHHVVQRQKGTAGTV